jgi:hypothetical protein
MDRPAARLCSCIPSGLQYPLPVCVQVQRQEDLQEILYVVDYILRGDGLELGVIDEIPFGNCGVEFLEEKEIVEIDKIGQGPRVA